MSMAPSSEVMGPTAPPREPPEAPLRVDQQPARAGAGPGGPENENRQLNKFPKEIMLAIPTMAFSAFWASAQVEARTTPIMLAASFFSLLAVLCILFAFLIGPPFNVDRSLGQALACISSCVFCLLSAFLELISHSKWNAVAIPALLLIFVVAVCWPGARQGVDPQWPDLKDMIFNFSVLIVTGSGVSFFGSSMLMISERFEWAGTALRILLFLIIAIGIVLMLFVQTIGVEWHAAAINLHYILVVLIAMFCVLSFVSTALIWARHYFLIC